MSTNFPADLDSFVNPKPTDNQDNPSHAGQHSSANDAIKALQAKVGVDSSQDANSLDSKVRAAQTAAAAAQATASDAQTAASAASAAVAGKQDKLDSTNLKTINGTTLLGSGNLVIDSGTGGTPLDVVNDLTTGGTSSALSAEQGKVLKGMVDTTNGSLANKADTSTVNTALAGKQDKRDLKTINGQSIVGTGDLTVSGTGGSVDPEPTTWDPANIQLDLVRGREAGSVDLTQDTTIVIGAGAVLNGSYNATIGGNFNFDFSAVQNGNGFAYSKTNWNNISLIKRPDAVYLFGTVGGAYSAPKVYITNSTFDTDGALPTGWESVNGTWSVSGGKLAGVWSTGSGALVVADSGLADGTVQLDVIGGSAAGYPTMVFRYQDSSNYWAVELADSVLGVHVYKIVAGTQVNVVTANSLFSDGATVTVKAVVSGDGVAVYSGGTLVWSGKDSFCSAATKHGALTFSTGSTGQFDNRVVHSSLDYPADAVAPGLKSASVSSPANEVVLEWNEQMRPDISPAAAFGVGNAGLGVSKTVTAHTWVDATHTKLTVSPAFTSSDTGFMLMYTAPATSKMSDLAGNAVADIAGTTIGNTVAPAGGTVIASDNFDRADGSPGATTVGGFAWVTQTSAKVQIKSNRLYSSGGDLCTDYLNVGTPNHSMQCDLLPNNTSGGSGIYIRGGQIKAIGASTNLRLSKVINGQSTELVFPGVAMDGVTTSKIELSADSSNLVTLKINDVVKYSAVVAELTSDNRVGVSFSDPSTCYIDNLVVKQLS